MGPALSPVAAGHVDELRMLLLRPEWLLAKLSAVGPYSLIGDFDLVRGDSTLQAVQGALRLALSALVADASQLPEQLLGRLAFNHSDRLESFKCDLRRLAPRPRLGARWPNLQGPGGELIQTLTRHDGDVNGAMVLDDGRVLSWSSDGTLRIWDVATGEGRSLTGHHGSVRGADALPDGRALSWGDDGKLRTWDLTTGEGHAIGRHEDSVDGALVLPEGRAMSWSNDGTLRVWDLATAEAHPLVGHESFVRGALPLPGGRARRGAPTALRVWIRHGCEHCSDRPCWVRPRRCATRWTRAVLEWRWHTAHLGRRDGRGQRAVRP